MPLVSVGLAVDGDAHAEGMSVHPRIRMTGRRRRQEMGGLEKEFFIDAHGGCLGDFACAAEPGLGAYGKPSSLWVCRLKRHFGWARQ